MVQIDEGNAADGVGARNMIEQVGRIVPPPHPNLQHNGVDPPPVAPYVMCEDEGGHQDQHTEVSRENGQPLNLRGGAPGIDLGAPSLPPLQPSPYLPVRPPERLARQRPAVDADPLPHVDQVGAGEQSRPQTIAAPEHPLGQRRGRSLPLRPGNVHDIAAVRARQVVGEADAGQVLSQVGRGPGPPEGGRLDRGRGGGLVQRREEGGEGPIVRPLGRGRERGEGGPGGDPSGGGHSVFSFLSFTWMEYTLVMRS